MKAEELGNEKRRRPSLVKDDSKHDDFDLKEFALCANRSEAGLCSIEMARSFWEHIDSFIRSHRTEPPRQIGLTAEPGHLAQIGDFTSRCENLSSLYRELFLNPGEAGLQRREFYRALHAHIEECLIEIAPLHPERGLSESDMQHVLLSAHRLRTATGHVLMQMEAFEEGHRALGALGRPGGL